MKNASTSLLLLSASLTAATLFAEPLRHPILALHGWNGSAGTWDNTVACFKASRYRDTSGTLRYVQDSDILIMDYYADKDDGYTSLGCSTDTPIEEVAELVLFSISEWRKNYSRNSTFNVVAHSMGGIVLRKMIASIQDNARETALAAGNTNLAFTADQTARGLLNRCITLGTPHFGQKLGIDKQSLQMQYASQLLWDLAEAWFFRGAAYTSMNYVAGCASDMLDFPSDGLVDTVSASMLTRGDSEFTNRVAYVDRFHSTVLGDHALCRTTSVYDPVFRLIHATFSEQKTAYGDGSGRWKADYAGNGWKFLQDDGFNAGETECRGEYTLLASTGLAFWRITADNDNPVKYYTGDKVISAARNASSGEDLKSYCFEQNTDNGHSLVWCTSVTQSGTKFNFQVGCPNKVPSGYSPGNFGYSNTRTVYGGGGQIFRTYPSVYGRLKHSITKTTCAGKLSTDTDALYNLGLLSSADDNRGADGLMNTSAPNGLSWPLCIKLGIVSDGSVPDLTITGFEITPTGALIDAGFGNLSFTDCGFNSVKLFSGISPEAIDIPNLQDSKNPRLFPLSGTSGSGFFRLSVGE